MAARCTICDHPQRHQIEAALRMGDSQRQVAQRFQVGKSTLGRHIPHVPGLAAAPALPTVAQAQDRRQQQATQPWAAVLPQLQDPFEHYCCALLMSPTTRPSAPPRDLVERLGPRGVAQQRRATIDALKTRYPFAEGTEHALSGVL